MLRRRLLLRALTLVFGAMAFALAAGVALPAVAAAPRDAAARMVVEAKELVYDDGKNTVTARGDVQIYYKGRILEADRVTYDRGTQRVYAEGHAKLTERDGSIVHAERFDLTDDFKTGFIESLQVDSADKTYFSSPHAERAGDSTIFDHGTYTACEACKDDPSRPRFWQVRAKRIIHDNVEKMIYYEDASFELLGTPIAYTPFFASADPSVKRKSGVLSPQFSYRTALGAGVGLPLYWAIAPNYDLTVTPTYFSKQGPFLTGEFRQRFENGSYMIRAEGAHISNPGAFAPAPLGAGNRRWRGIVQSVGEFALNDQWKAGWDITVLSDRFFMQDYRHYGSLFSNYYFRETSSTIYLTGQGPRSYFDMRGYYFQGLSPADLQGQLPIVHPVLDYNRTFDIDPAKTAGIGGQVEVDANVTSSSAQIANYESIRPRTFDSVTGLHNVCQIYAPAADRSQSTCLLRNIGGNYESATLNASWKRKFIDPLGGVVTPFAFARFFGSYLDYDTAGVYPYLNNARAPLPNSAQAWFLNGADNRFRGQATPGAGVDWRYPLLVRAPIGDIVVEPIAQIVARPNQSSIPSLANIDAQSLVFDDSTLFEWSKYSGYDRFETGTRVNYGGQATLTLPNSGFVNAMVGQSRQVAGANPYATADAANVGLASGLDKRSSDVVGRVAVAPNSFVSLVAKGRFDEKSFNARRVDLVSSFKVDPITLELQYANYQAQSPIGFDRRRQGLSATGRYDLTKNYFVTGMVTFDMSRYLYNQYTTSVSPVTFATLTGINLIGSAPVFSIATLGFGAGYHDECTTLSVNYSSVYQPTSLSGLPVRNQTVMLSLQFRTLGEAKFNYGLGTVPVTDGVRMAP